MTAVGEMPENQKTLQLYRRDSSLEKLAER